MESKYSKSSQNFPVFLNKLSANIVAPNETASSGFIESFIIVLLNFSFKIFFIFGIRLEPPTNIISLISSLFKFISFKTLSIGGIKVKVLLIFRKIHYINFQNWLL